MINTIKASSLGYLPWEEHLWVSNTYYVANLGLLEIRAWKSGADTVVCICGQPRKPEDDDPVLYRERGDPDTVFNGALAYLSTLYHQLQPFVEDVII